MIPVTGKEAAGRVAGIMNEKYQIHAYSVDLTVKQVFQLDPSGQVDFGGAEYVPGEKLPQTAVRRLREDKYKWWDLARGSYLVEYNETVELAADEIGVLESDMRLQRAGATHATMFLRGRVAPIEVLMEVGVLHVQVKENARISKLRVFRVGGEEETKRKAASKKR